MNQHDIEIRHGIAKKMTAGLLHEKAIPSYTQKMIDEALADTPVLLREIDRLKADLAERTKELLAIAEYHVGVVDELNALRGKMIEPIEQQEGDGLSIKTKPLLFSRPPISNKICVDISEADAYLGLYRD